VSFRKTEKQPECCGTLWGMGATLNQTGVGRKEKSVINTLLNYRASHLITEPEAIVGQNRVEVHHATEAVEVTAKEKGRIEFNSDPPLFHSRPILWARKRSVGQKGFVRQSREGEDWEPGTRNKRMHADMPSLPAATAIGSSHGRSFG
jgi:hypothetical protein